MRDSDLQQFTELLDAVCSLISRGTYTPNAVNTALWFRSLREYTLDTVRAALDAHVRDPQRGRYVPTPADLIAQIDGVAANDGRLGAEEAWALALRARDEAETVVWTREIAEAVGIAKPILDVGDEVGARMAFREAYNRLVDEARRQHMPVSWEASLGFDANRRDVAIRAAVDSGRLSLSALPAPEGEQLPLLTLANSPRVPEHIRAELRRLSDAFRGGFTQPSVDALARAETQAHRADAAKRAQEYAEQNGIDLQPTPTAAPMKPEASHAQ